MNDIQNINVCIAYYRCNTYKYDNKYFITLQKLRKYFFITEINKPNIA